MSELFDDEIFKGKTFSQLLKEIYTKSINKSTQITMLIDELKPLVKSIGDATVIVPLIKDYMDVGVRNDELLIKMSVVIQRHLQKSKDNDDSGIGFGITQEEMADLMKESEKTDVKVEDVIKTMEKVTHDIQYGSKPKTKE